MKRWTLIGLALVLPGCVTVTTDTDDYFYNEIIIRNSSTVAVTDVVISVDKTKMSFSCSYVAPKGECSNKFRKRKYMGNAIRVQWAFNERMNSTRQFRLAIPENFTTSKMIRGVLDISGNGKISPYLEQYESY